MKMKHEKILVVENDTQIRKFICRMLTNNGSRAASFSANNTTDTVRILSNGKIKALEIFGHNEGTAEVEVWGVNAVSGTEACINKGGSVEDRLIIKVYAEHVFDPFNVYIANNTGFNPTADQWQDGFNSILEQMVARLDQINIMRSANGWDYNGNGVLDVIMGLGVTENDKSTFNADFPADREWESEHSRLVDLTGDVEDVCDENKHTHFMVPGSIRFHYVVTDIARHGLKLNTLTGIRYGDRYPYRITRYHEQNDATDEVIILLEDPFQENVVGFRKQDGGTLLNTYIIDDNITIYRDISVNDTTSRMRGFSLDNCSFAEGVGDYSLHVHEFLHHTLNGNYPHVLNSMQYPYGSNLMKPTPLRGSDVELRYRSLREADNEGTYSQWSYIGRRYYE